MRIRRKSSSRGRRSSWRERQVEDTAETCRSDQKGLLIEDESTATVGHLQGLLLGSPFDEQVLVEQAPGLRPDASVSLGNRLHAALQPDDAKSKRYLSGFDSGPMTLHSQRLPE